MLIKFVQTIINLLGWLLDIILLILPESPFLKLEAFSVNSKFLAAANYFLPVREIAATCELWLAAIAVYYVWMVVGRWAKVFD